MNKLAWILAVAMIVAGCDREEPPAPETEEPVDAVEETIEEPMKTGIIATDTDEEIEVVEESSGDDVESTDEAIVLAKADIDETPRDWKFQEGRHFTRMVPTQPTIGGPDKVEVSEVFMYSCNHCMTLESYMQDWEKTADPNVRFERIPAIFNQLAAVHAQLYYTEEVLARNGELADRNAFRNMVFDEFHRRGNRLASEASIQRVFERAGIDQATFEKTWNSFEVNQSMRRAADLARRYNVSSVPLIVVNGKYRTSTGAAGGYPALIELIDELTAREGVR